MKYLLHKLTLVTYSYLQLSIIPCSATPQDLEGQDIKPQNLQSHNCFSNPLIFVDQGTYHPGKIVNASNSDLAGVLSVSIISLINHSLFNNTQLIPDNRRRFLTELGLGGRSLQENTLKQGLHLRIAQVH
jgi:starvation-inducible outer membrane lipoprotein